MWHENKHGDLLFLFRIFLSCNNSLPSFIGNLWRVLLLGNHLKKMPMITKTVNTFGLLTKFVRSRWLDIGQVLFFVCLYGPRRSRGPFVSVHKLAKKERGQHPAILTEQTWSIKDLLYGFRGIFLAG